MLPILLAMSWKKTVWICLCIVLVFKINFHIQNISVITKTNHLLNISPHPEDARTLPFAHLSPLAHAPMASRSRSPRQQREASSFIHHHSSSRTIIITDHSSSWTIIYHLSSWTIIRHDFCHHSSSFLSSSWSTVCSLSLSMLLCTFVSSLIFLIHDFLFVIIICYWYYDHCYSFYAFSFLSVSW